MREVNMKRKRKDEGVSEILGTVLLLGISVALFSVLYLMLQNVLVAEHTPVADLIGYIDGDTVFIEHHGGNSLPRSTVITVSVGGIHHIIDFDDSFDRNNNGYWDIGEQVYLEINLSQINEPVAVVVSVLDVTSNTLLYSGTLKDGGVIDEQDNGDISINLNTSVDLIKPYEQTDPPLTITATGDSNLDNVTLYYRYSASNFTIPAGKTWEDADGNLWYIQNFTSGNGEWEVPAGVTSIDVLVVGGGGGSGKGGIQGDRNAGGGGAGGLIWIQNVTQLGNTGIGAGNTIDYNVGSGGAGSTDHNNPGDSGGDTVFGNLTAKGGGGGGSRNNEDGLEGGSGGGGAIDKNSLGQGGTSTQNDEGGWSEIFGNGTDGANAISNSAGGGGGAGSSGSGTTGGTGWDMSAYFGTSYGNNGWFASGGGAHDEGIDAVPNSGMGGRAQATSSSANGRAGGTGIILIRWRVTEAEWTVWTDSSNPDSWSWNFTFPNGTGYYEFFSIGSYNGQFEDMKSEAEAMCYYTE